MFWLEPGSFRYSLSKGDQGTDVAALQINIGVVVDGDFGSKTKDAIQYWQRDHGLTADGEVGPKTFQSLVVELSTPAARFYHLPIGMAKSVAFTESNFVIGASGKHFSDGGYDVGPYMHSSGTQPGSQSFYFDCYNVGRAADLACRRLRDNHDAVPQAPVKSQYLTELADGDTERFRWQMAVLSHNWPAAAYAIPRQGHIFTDAARDDQPAQWIEQASGGRLHTPREWVANYVKRSTTFVQ